MNKTSPTLISVQLLRAVAAWMVVFHHFAYFFLRSSDGWFSTFFTKYGAVGVDVFFVICGFVMYKSTFEKDVTPKAFIFNRVTRVVPVYWFFTCLTALVLLRFNDIIPQTEFTFVFLLKSLFFIPSQNPSGVGPYPLLTIGWTLNYEMAFYLIFGASLFFRLKYRLAIVAAGVFVLQKMMPDWGAGFYFYFCKMGYEFLMGIAVGVIYCRGWLRFPLVVAIAMTAISFAVITTFDIVHDYLRVGFPCAVIVAAAISQEHFNLRTNKWLIKLGDWSYSTYLCQIIVLSFCYQFAQIFFINIWVAFALCCSMILLVSWISYTFIEWHTTRLIKKSFGSMFKARVAA